MNTNRSAIRRAATAARAPVVLLVDDEPNLLHALPRALREQPYRINTAHAAEEAIEILKAHRVDLIVSDEHMPGMTGTKFLAWVAEHYPKIVRIILTGQPTVDSTIRAINEGSVFRYFTKPFDVVQLALAIREGLEAQGALAAPTAGL